jgi:hypothetical protein
MPYEFEMILDHSRIHRKPGLRPSTKQIIQEVESTGVSFKNKQQAEEVAYLYYFMKTVQSNKK